MSPYQIEILLYYYYSSIDEFPEKQAPIFKETIQRFVDLGLILATPSPLGHPCCYSYFGNKEALQVYIDALSNVPLPVQRWVVEQPLNIINSYKKGNN